MKFSLVIPVAPERGAEILKTIKKLNYPKKEFESIVIKGKNPSENRNKGAKKSKGKIIGFLDDDAVVEKDFLKNVEKFFNKYPEIDVCGGPQLTPKDEKGFAKISGYALSSKFGSAGAASRYNKGKLNLNTDESSITSANLFVRKNVMNKVKFDINLFPGEDPKFIEDCLNAGFKVAYCPDFIIYHRRRASIKKLIKQIFNYGKVRTIKESFWRTLKMPMFLVPYAFVIYLFILILASIFDFFLKITIIPLFLYLWLNIMFTIYESTKNKDFKALLLLPFIFLLIHISYGFGMIYGYIKKIFK